MAKKDMLMVALGKQKPEDEMDDEALDYGADEDMGDESPASDAESAVLDDLVDAGFSQEKAEALVDAILSLKP